MCLYENEIKNPATLKYGNIEKGHTGMYIPKDPRQYTIKIPCGICRECVKKKQSEWKIRMIEEIKKNENKNMYMVTLTFTNKKLDEICNKYGEWMREDAEAVAIKAVKLFRERFRKKHKKSIKRFLVTELGHNMTERIHMHGVLVTDVDLRAGHRNGGPQNRYTFSNGLKTGFMSTSCELAKIWSYGQVHIGEYCTEKTCGYIVKYITKRDKNHPGFRPKILISPGWGKGYIDDNTIQKHKFNYEKTNTKYKCNTGVEVELPKYYKNKLYTEEEKAELWSEALDRETVWINGHEIKKSANWKEYDNAVKKGKEDSLSAGYEDGKIKDKKKWPIYLEK